MGIEVYEIREFEQFLEMETEWNWLLSESYYDAPFLRHEWLRTWWSHFGDGKQLSIILARDDGCLVFAMPLMEVRMSLKILPFIVLQSLTNYHSYRYQLILQRGREDVITPLFDYICHRPYPWHLLLLQLLPSDTDCHKLFLETALTAKHHAEVWTAGQAPYLPVGCTWDEYQKSLKSKFRGNLKRQNKRLCRLGTVEYEGLDSSLGISEALSDAFEIEKKGWKGTQGTAIACSSKLTNFYSEIAKIGAEKKWLRLSFLKVGGRRIAFNYTLVYKNRMYSMKIGYDPEYRPFSVGHLLKFEIHKRSFESGIIEIDLSPPSTASKRDWTNLYRNIEWLYIYNKSLISDSHHFYKFKIKPKLKQMAMRYKYRI